MTRRQEQPYSRFPPGDRVRRALALREQLAKVISQAVVAEREEGASWTAIGQAAGGITRQAAAERWSPAVTAWTRNGRRALSGSSGLTVWDAAASLDHAYARLNPDHAHAFSSTLNAVRFPEQEADRVRREQAAATGDRLRRLRETTDRLSRDFHAATAPAARASLLRRRASAQDEAAQLLTDLAMLEPDLADEHRSAAGQCEAQAAADREFADLLQPQDTPTLT
ncbi:hypothetical protein [Streptomyces sp. NPDC051636]|uniref:hypothetical protein n=1 Tax=Streptomyces sp. NPDC051636 TaxID=3365663 RepID=UPI003795418B